MDIDLSAFKLSCGAHIQPSDGMCFMEASAWMAGLPHSDSPPCVAPSLAQSGRYINDAMPDEYRHLLNGMVLKVLDTVSPEHEARRNEFMLSAIFIRLIPIALDGLNDNLAAQFRALPASGDLKDFSALDLDLALDLALARARAFARARALALDRAKPFEREKFWREAAAILDEAIELGPYNKTEFYDIPELRARLENYQTNFRARESVTAS